MKFLELAEKVLRDNSREMTVDEIWNYIMDKGLDKELNSAGATPSATLSASLGDSVRNRRDKSPFDRTDTRPTRYFLRSQVSKLAKSEIDETEPIAITPTTVAFAESDLHPFLAHYARHFLKTFTKTIEHKNSNKKEYGEWKHPDMVGCSGEFEELKPEVSDLSKTLGSLNVKLSSFEIKKEVADWNLRESFFQTVSNSSWANESYLVAAKFSVDEEFRNELKRLSTSFGIGIIELNIFNPNDTTILFQPVYREQLDWDTINELAKRNPDFNKFLKRIKIDIDAKEIRRELYDKVFTTEELVAKIKH